MRPQPGSNVTNVIVVVVIRIICHPVQQVVLLYGFLSQGFQCRNDGIECLDFLCDDIFQGDVPVLFKDPGVGRIIIQQRRAKIRIAEFIDERLQGIVSFARHVRLTVQDFIQAVTDVLLIRCDMRNDILDGPVARHAFQGHAACEADPIQGQFELITFV